MNQIKKAHEFLLQAQQLFTEVYGETFNISVDVLDVGFDFKSVGDEIAEKIGGVIESVQVEEPMPFVQVVDDNGITYTVYRRHQDQSQG